MDQKQRGCVTNLIVGLLVFLGIFIYSLVFAANIYKTQTALLETGVQTEATAEKVKHKGITEWGKIYVRLQYEVNGEPYSSDVPISMRTYQLPGGKVKDGKVVVSVAYDENDPAQVGFEGAAKTARTARTWSIVLVCICGASLGFWALVLIAAKYSN